MNVFQLLRYFLPLQNPAGFGLTDFLELGLASLFVAAVLMPISGLSPLKLM